MSTSRERTEAILFGATSAPSASPSRRIGVAPKTQRGYGVPTREPTIELEPKALRGRAGNPGQLDRMERGHPRIAAGVRSLELAVAARPPVLVGHEDETAIEAAFRETMQAAVIDAPYVDASNGAGGWSLLAQHLAAYWHRGAFVGSARLVSKAGASYPLPYLNGLAVEVFPVHLSSVQDWITDIGDRSRLVGVRQQTTDQGQVEIPGDRLIHLQHGGAVGEFEGVSVMRPLVFLFERWAGLMTARERNAHLQGGLNVVGSPAAVSEDDQAVLLQWLDAVGLPYIAMPQGYAAADLDTRYTSGSQGSDGEIFQYVDAQIDRVFGEALQSLGSSSHGSRALGEELADAGDWQRAASLQMLYDAFVHRVGGWLAAKVGYVGRLPLVSLDADAGEDVNERVATLVPAVAQGLVTWTPDDEAELRSLMGLSEREQATESRTLLVGQIQAAQQIVGSLNPTDPTVSPIAPAAALELLTAAGVPAESARNIINATLEAAGRPLLPAPDVVEPVSTELAESYEPPKGVRETAARALEMRRELPPSRRGGTDVGVARARDLANGRPVSLDTLKRMRAYFDRHEVDKGAEGFNRGEDGYPSKGRIAWDLWGGDAGQAWANDKIPTETREHVCGASCSHGVEFADKRNGAHTVIGADGITYRTSVEELRGPETFVAWATLDQDRRGADQSMRAEIGRAMDAHRADTWSALRDGWQPGERAEVRNRAIERYKGVLDTYRDSVALVIGRHAAQEFARQIGAGVAPTAPEEGVAPSALGARDSRIDAQIEIVAEGMAGRVQSEVETAWGMGQTRRTFVPALTAAQVAAPALVIGSSVESAGRLEYARTVGAAGDGRGGPDVAPGPAGLRIVRVIRSSVADNNRCQHCKGRHGDTYEFPRDLDRFEEADNQLPDPNCEGARWGSGCRCGWLIEWGRDDD